MLGPLADRLVLAGEAGVDLLQIREPDLSAAELGGLVRALRTRLRRRRRPRHRQRAASTSRLPRRPTASTSSPIRFRRRWSGGTCRRPSWLADPCTPSTKREAAEAEGADYVIFGTVFPSGSKPRGHRTGRARGAGCGDAGRPDARAGHRRHLVEHRRQRPPRRGPRGSRRSGCFSTPRGRWMICGGGSSRPSPGSAAPSSIPDRPEPADPCAMPLLECFVRGDVDPEVSLLAAQGALAPRADEQLAILVYLVTHDETHVATVANQTIAALPVEAVAGLLARQDTSQKVLAFFAARGIVPAAVATEDTDAPLVDTGDEVVVEAEPAEGRDAAAGDDRAAAPQAGDEGLARAARGAGPRSQPDDRRRGAEQPEAGPDRGRGVRAHGQRLRGRAADDLDEPGRGCASWRWRRRW